MEREVPAKGGPCGPKCRSRFILVILGALGMGIIYGMKVALHVAIVTMINHTAIAIESPPESLNSTTCNFPNVSHPLDGEFQWSKSVEGYLLSSYFWGYMVAQVPGGRIAEVFSAKWVYFFAVAINVVAMLLCPLMASLHWGGLLAMRILQGIGGGVTFPASHVLLAHWTPPSERSTSSGIVYAGTAIGTVIFMLLAGLIADWLNWQAVFYILGGVSAIWLVLWVWLIADTPAKQPRISERERSYIIHSLEVELGAGKKTPHRRRVPWKAVATSKPFIAILVAHTCSNWGWYLLLIELPTYMKSMLKFNIKENAGLSAMPFLIMWIFSIVLGRSLDMLRAREKITVTTARKIATLIASVVPMLCLIVLCFNTCNRALAVAMMTIAITGIGGMFSGFLANHIDIAPNYAGTLMAITNTVATIPGIVVPIVTGALTAHKPGIESWRIIFYITISLYVVEILVYTFFGSGNIQAWNKVPDEPTEDQPLSIK